jgi:hypothetical protein
MKCGVRRCLEAIVGNFFHRGEIAIKIRIDSVSRFFWAIYPRLARPLNTSVLRFNLLYSSEFKCSRFGFGSRFRFGFGVGVGVGTFIAGGWLLLRRTSIHWEKWHVWKV